MLKKKREKKNLSTLNIEKNDAFMEKHFYKGKGKTSSRKLIYQTK